MGRRVAGLRVACGRGTGGSGEAPEGALLQAPPAMPLCVSPVTCVPGDVAPRSFQASSSLGKTQPPREQQQPSSGCHPEAKRRAPPYPPAGA